MPSRRVPALRGLTVLHTATAAVFFAVAVTLLYSLFDPFQVRAAYSPILGPGCIASALAIIVLCEAYERRSRS